jgi:hypothetical protein
VCYTITPNGAQRLPKLCLPVRGDTWEFPEVKLRLSNIGVNGGMCNALSRVNASRRRLSRKTSGTDHPPPCNLEGRDGSHQIKKFILKSKTWHRFHQGLKRHNPQRLRPRNIIMWLASLQRDIDMTFEKQARRHGIVDDENQT